MARTWLACGHYVERENPQPTVAAICPWGCGFQDVDPEPISTGPVQIMPDVPEHYNVTLDTVVRSRRHLKQLQVIHGCRDFEPVKEGPHTDYRRKRQRQGRRIA